jgi:hypothetical protein
MVEDGLPELWPPVDLQQLNPIALQQETLMLLAQV